jgi:hypothetical protein
MTILWPRLPDAVASQEYEKLLSGTDPTPAARHPEQIYGPVGGRVPDSDVGALLNDIQALAEQQGYPAPAADASRIRFDRLCAPLLHTRMDLSWAEAGSGSVWSFLSLVVLPHVTLWRFGISNKERWLATDLTRHTWARLWWQAVVFADAPELLDALTESDLNQLLERRSIGGDPRLVVALGRSIVRQPGDVPRRYLIRNAALQLRRWLAFLDVRALDDVQVTGMCDQLADETARRYRADAQT